MGAKSLSRFFWHIYTNFPFPAHVYLICALRYRTTGELADRAWKQLEASFDRRSKSEMVKRRGNQASSLHMAMANLTVKSWEARESAHRELQPKTPTPRFIQQFREKLASRKSSNCTPQSDASPPEIGTQVGNQFEDAYQWLNHQQPPFETQSFDQSNILMPDSSTMDWSFWNGIGQVPLPDFDNALPNQAQGFYQSWNFMWGLVVPLTSTAFGKWVFCAAFSSLEVWIRLGVVILHFILPSCKLLVFGGVSWRVGQWM